MPQTKDEFKARVREWAQKLEVDTRIISLRSMTRKWASYTQTSGLLIFNAALLEMDEAVKDYVIVHELLHIRIPNHGKLWKSFMRAYLGDYEQLEQQLRQTKNLTGLEDL